MSGEAPSGEQCSRNQELNHFVEGAPIWQGLFAHQLIHSLLERAKARRSARSSAAE